MSSRSLTFRRRDESFEVRVTGPDRDGSWSASVAGEQGDRAPAAAALRAQRGERDGEVLVESRGGLARLAVLRSGRGAWIAWRGRSWYLERTAGGRAHHGASAAEATDDVRAPMTGTLLEVRVGSGQRVAKEQVLVVLEAMKMEYRLTSPREGEVAEVRREAGDRVELGDVLVRLAPEASPASAPGRA